MQLVTIECREVAGRPGVVTETGEILDLGAAPTTLQQAQWIPQSVVSILAAGEDGHERVSSLLHAAANADLRALRDAGVLLPMAQTQLMAPVRRPSLVLVQERTTATDEPDPVVSIKSPNTVVGPAQRIALPWQAADGGRARPLLGIVLGRPLHRAGAAEAAEAIAACTLLLDISQPPPGASSDAASWRRYLDSKQFPGACPVGPALATVDELGPDQSLDFSLSVNGVETCAMSRSVEDLPATLASLSARYGFRPGDVVGFDLPMDVDDPRNCQDGDRVELVMDGVMSLETTLAF